MTAVRLTVRLAAAFLASLLVLAAHPARAQADDPFGRYAAYDEASGTVIDYAALSEILGEIVYDVGPSDRFAPTTTVQLTGTRITGQNPSRYRNEGNRIALHVFNETHAEIISAYRAELEALASDVGLSGLNRNEQLAYWLNLHNIVVIDELARAYPLRRVDQMRVSSPEGRMALHDAKIIEIDGHRLSLNDIRLNIVQRYWPDPRVMYGFFSGAIGGPSLQDEAFTGANLPRLLNRAAREYVNALRGVETGEDPLRVSPLYEEHRALFPDWPEDLLAHLAQFATDDVADLVDAASEVRTLRYDWNIADMTHGVTACGVSTARNVIVQRNNQEVQDGPVVCDPLPEQARVFVADIELKRGRLFEQGRLGRVFVDDLETDGEGNLVNEDGTLTPIESIRGPGEG